jgi:hypothetical protein
MASPRFSPDNWNWSDNSSSSSATPSPQTKKLRFNSNSAEQINTDASAEAYNGSPKTRRVKRSPKVAANGGEIGSKGKPKGEIRYNTNGALEYFLEHLQTWASAVYHNDIRAALIEEAAHHGHYDNVRSSGRGTTDVTSFLPAHKTWGAEREDWPEVLLHGRLQKKKENELSQSVPLWYYGGYLVLDHDNDPMRYLPDTLPATCSAQMDDWELLAIFESDPRISLADIRGRMPAIVTLASGIQKPLFRMNAISMRMHRFRAKADISPDLKRPGSAGSERGSQSPRKFSDDGMFPTPENVHQIQETNLRPSTNKRSAESIADREGNSYIIGSPTKKARSHFLQSTSTTSNDSSPKLTGSESSSPWDYNKAHARATDLAPVKIVRPQNLSMFPVQFQAFMAGIRHAQKMMSNAGVNIPRAYNTNVIRTPLRTPILGHNTQENIGLEDPFWDGPLKASANISPIPFLQPKARPSTGSIFTHKSRAESNMTAPAVMKSPDTVIAQDEPISDDLAEFLANLDRVDGNNSDGIPIYSQEQTGSFEQMGNAVLPHKSPFTDTGPAQDGTISEDLTEFIASVPVLGGDYNDRISIYENEHTWPLEQTGNTAVLTESASADTAFSSNKWADFTTMFPAMVGQNNDEIPIYEYAQTSPPELAGNIVLPTATYDSSTAQIAATSSPSTLRIENDSTPIWDEELPVVGTLDDCIGKAPGQVENRLAPMTTEPVNTSSDQDIDPYTGLPPIIGIDEHGSAIWADGFRFRPEDLVDLYAVEEPVEQSQGPQEPLSQPNGAQDFILF